MTPATPKSVLAALMAANVALFCVENVLYARIDHAMQGFTYATIQLLFPLSSLLLHWPLVGVLIWSGFIDAQRDCKMPLRRLAALAAMAAVQTLMGAVAAGHLSGALQTLVGNSIPETMLLSALILGSRYKRMHVAGACLVLAGIFVAVLPDIREPAGNALYVFILILPNLIPRFIYLERWLKESDPNLFWFQAALSTVQVPISAALVVSLFVHLPGSAQVPPTHLPNYFSAAKQCFMGHTPSYVPMVGHAVAEPSCEPLLGIWVVFMLLSLVMAFAREALIKYGSAALARVVLAIRLPVQVFLYRWKFLAGATAKSSPVSWETGVALAVIVCGVVVYGVAGNEPSPLPTRRLDSTSVHRSTSSRRHAVHRSLEAAADGYMLVDGEDYQLSGEGWEAVRWKAPQ